MEDWKEVEEYNGYYEVSACGDVRSCTRVIERSDGVVQKRRGRILTKSVDDDGYYVVTLSKGGISKKVPVHRLVAIAFLGNPGCGYEVNHKDFDRTNNNVENLEWLSHADNICKTIDAGRHVTQTRDMSGSHNPNFGNRALSQRYKDDAELSKEKQSRPGSHNGRAQSVRMMDESGREMSFPYILACASYLVENRLVRCENVGYVANRISHSFKSGTNFAGMKFSI